MATDYRILQSKQRTQQCAACQSHSHLEVAWRDGRDTLWCPRCRATDGFVPKPKSLHKQWQENPDSLPLHIANRFWDTHAAEVEEIARGLPPDLAEIVRGKFLGQRIPTKEQKCRQSSA